MTYAAIAVGAGSAIFSAIKGGQAKRERDRLEAETKAKIAALKPDAGIADFYNQAYNQYSANPYQSLEYNQQQRATLASQAKSIGALRESGTRNLVGNIGAVQGMTDKSLQDAAARAEAAKRQNLSMLGQAAQMKAADEWRIKGLDISTTAQEAAARAAEKQQYDQNIASAVVGMGTAAASYGSTGTGKNIFGGKGFSMKA
jgi:hypothetical protein